MPRKRQPTEIWRQTRVKVLERDSYSCTRCKEPVTVSTAHIDHVRSGKLGSNHINNLRTLCIICHATRADFRHRGLTYRLIRAGKLPSDWRHLAWEG